MDIASWSAVAGLLLLVMALYEGVGRLIDSGAILPGLHHAGDPQRIALEAYPRRLAHAIVARRSYKNSAADDRRAAREAIVPRSKRAPIASASPSSARRRCALPSSTMPTAIASMPFSA